MSAKFKVVDLFAGPGGLAEGFSSVKDVNGARVFDIALSVEKEQSAHRTLRLRSFFRQFDAPPSDYYDYIAGRLELPLLQEKYRQQWDAAEAEARRLELGTDAAQGELDPVLDELRREGAPTVLIGGPPCQAYSLVGRARNRGIEGYDPAKDHRHFLYREYIRIIGRLRPAAFVMENVKGILSSRVGGDAIFKQVLSDLRAAGGSEDSYALVPLVRGESDENRGFIVRCEQFGIPQSRHRVIILGLRRDLASRLGSGVLEGLLEVPGGQASVADVLGGMPALRSGLSRDFDSPEAWRTAVSGAMTTAARACNSQKLRPVAGLLRAAAREISVTSQIPPRQSLQLTAPRNNKLAEWLSDPNLKVLSNQETRGHMQGDLSRYAFAAAFAQIFESSPKASEFPETLAPRHDNWKSGKFADRFRVQIWGRPSTTVTSHISKDGHYFIHPDLGQCRSLTVREAARLQTFPDNYHFEGNRTQQFVQVGNAVPPLMASLIARALADLLGPLLEE